MYAIEASCEFNAGSINENKKNIDELHKSLKETMKHEKDTQARMVVCDERLNAMGRRSREWGIRLLGVGETHGEDVKKILPKYVFLKRNLGGTVTLEQALEIVEHYHRIGSIVNNGSTTRPIIRTIVTRPLRNAIILFAKANLSGSTAGEDMIKEDYERKKTVFRRGKLIIDGVVVPVA